MDFPVRTYVFDAYGTLFDVHSAVARHSQRVGHHATALSELWRSRQVEYSWTYSLMGIESDFWTLTKLALDHAMKQFGLQDSSLRSDLLDSYLELDAYPEVPELLRSLKKRGHQVIILTNGTQDMVSSAIRSAGLSELIDATFSVDQVKIFKPHPSVYELITKTLGVTAAEISFQTSNQWDAAGAGTFGFRVVWVNRKGLPREYELGFERKEVASLASLAAE
jgi:2-haloacid dehalogenase